jgi:hypothetical protein
VPVLGSAVENQTIPADRKPAARLEQNQAAGSVFGLPENDDPSGSIENGVDKYSGKCSKAER